MSLHMLTFINLRFLNHEIWWELLTLVIFGNSIWLYREGKRFYMIPWAVYNNPRYKRIFTRLIVFLICRFSFSFCTEEFTYFREWTSELVQILASRMERKTRKLHIGVGKYRYPPWQDCRTREITHKTVPRRPKYRWQKLVTGQGR